MRPVRPAAVRAQRALPKLRFAVGHLDTGERRRNRVHVLDRPPRAHTRVPGRRALRDRVRPAGRRAAHADAPGRRRARRGRDRHAARGGVRRRRRRPHPVPLPSQGEPVRLGITTPLFTMTPDGHAPWEVDAQLDDVVPLVEAADRLGYEYVTCSEHVVIPDDVAPVRGGRYWDPLATFGYLSAVTTRIRFATYVLVLGYHHPLAIAKRYGTLDRISGGRLILGVGVGSLQPEFEMLGAPFDDRGARGDESLRALRTSFGRREPEFHGEL